MIIGIRAHVRIGVVANMRTYRRTYRMGGYDYLITHLDTNCEWNDEWIGPGGIAWDEPS